MIQKRCNMNFGHVLPLTLTFLRSTQSKCMKTWFFWLYDANSSTWYNGTITGTWHSCWYWYLHQHQSYIIPLNNRLNISKGIVSLMAPPGSSCCHAHAKNWYAPQIPHLHQYICLILTHCNNNVNGISGIHTIYIIGICHWTNMHATLYMHVPVHSYCGLHIHPISLLI